MKNKIKLALILGLLIVNGIHQISSAQEAQGWTPARRIPGLSDDVWTPYLVVDQNQTVHAFVSDRVGEEGSIKAILYSRWSRDQGWSLPVDILLSPHHEARVKGAFLDTEGVMHVVFFGGEDYNAEIYYSQAPAVSADQAQAWSQPIIVGKEAITPDEAAIAGDSQGNLHIVFGARQDGNSLYSVHSSDGGQTWSEPVPVFLTQSDVLWPSHLQIYVDFKANLHAVWSVADFTGNGLANYYAKFEAGTSDWTEPIVLAHAINSEADTPSIIEYNDELFVIYHNDRPTTRWMRRSQDGGQSWSEPVRLFEHVGSNGAAALVVDGSNKLHMFFGNRVGDFPETHGMWHSEWINGRWNAPEAIVSGQATVGFDPARASATVSQGNLILVSWMQEPGQINRGTANGAWYSYLSIESEELPIVPLPTASLAMQSILIDSGSVLSQETPEPVQTKVNIPSSVQTFDSVPSPNPMRQILVGIFPAMVLLLVFIIILRRNRQ